MEDEVMRFEITDQDLEEEMSSSYGKKRYLSVFTNWTVIYTRSLINDMTSTTFFSWTLPHFLNYDPDLVMIYMGSKDIHILNLR